MRATQVFWALLLCTSCRHPVAEHTVLQGNSVPIAPPVVQVDSLLFKTSTKISLTMNAPGSEIKYGWLSNDQVHRYTDPLTVKKSGILWAQCLHPDFMPSDTVRISVYHIKNNKLPKNISLAPEPSPSYSGGGTAILTDLKRGNNNFRKGTSWLGFEKGQATLTLAFETPVRAKRLSIGYLHDPSAWIYAPIAAVVTTGDNDLGETRIATTVIPQQKMRGMVHVTLKDRPVDQLVVQVLGPTAIPEGHPGEGSHPWLFIDEIIVE